LVTVHGVAGPGTVQGLKEVGLEKGRGCILLAQMSSSGNLLSEEYTASIVKMAQEHKDFVIGFVTQNTVLNDDGFINFTPGIGIAEAKDNLGQQYNDPRFVTSKRGTDVIIVGRHIYKAKDPLAEAIRYREQGWLGYLDRV
jgi:uridine monophosphate synthetase